MPKVDKRKQKSYRQERYTPFAKRPRRRVVSASQSPSYMDSPSSSKRQSSSHVREDLIFPIPMWGHAKSSGYVNQIPLYGAPRKQSSDVQMGECSCSSHSSSTHSMDWEKDSFISIYNVLKDEHMVPRKNKLSILENLNNPHLMNCPFEHGIANVRHKQLMENYEISSDVEFILPPVSVDRYIRQSASRTSFLKKFKKAFRKDRRY